MIKKLILSICAVGILSACDWIYRAPMQQGNIITQSAVDQLKIGMTPEQVYYVLGSPVLSSSDVLKQWDYVDYYDRKDGKPIKKRLRLLFEQGKLVKFN